MLYLLRPIEEDIAHPFDVALGFVVRASTPKEARQLASEKHGDEGPDFWLDRRLSTCSLFNHGKSKIILRDFYGS